MMVQGFRSTMTEKEDESVFYEMSRNVPPLNWPESKYGVMAKRIQDGRIVSIPVQPQVNALIVGTPGYGKTVFTKEYVKGLFAEDPAMYAVFFQIKPDDFTEAFLRPRDKVITYSDHVCSNQNLFQWNLTKEIRSCERSEWESELDEITSILFSDILLDQRNRIWADAARNTLKAFVNVILYCYKNNPSNCELIRAMKFMKREELLKFMAKCPQNHSMLKDNFEFDPNNCEHYAIPRKGSDILFFLNNVLEKFGGTFMSEDGEDTIYDYLHGNYGERLFIMHDHKKKNSSKLFERYFLKYIGDEILSQTSAFSGKMVWVLDEIDKIEGDFGLTQAVTLGRQFGLQVLVSTQSMESLYAIAPELYGEHLTNASLSGFGMQAAFHPGDPYTIETLQTLWGRCRKQTITMPLSRYDKPTVITEQRSIVEDSDFASLDTGECYIKIRSSWPERVKILI